MRNGATSGQKRKNFAVKERPALSERGQLCNKTGHCLYASALCHPAAHFLQKPHISKVSRLGLNIHLEVTVFLCHSGLFCSNPLIEDNTYLGRCDRFFLSNASYL